MSETTRERAPSVDPFYDPDSRRWMVCVDQFVSRPATEREAYDVEIARFKRAVSEATVALGWDVVEDLFERARDAR